MAARDGPTARETGRTAAAAGPEAGTASSVSLAVELRAAKVAAGRAVVASPGAVRVPVETPAAAREAGAPANGDRRREAPASGAVRLEEGRPEVVRPVASALTGSPARSTTASDEVAAGWHRRRPACRTPASPRA